MLTVKKLKGKYRGPHPHQGTGVERQGQQLRASSKFPGMVPQASLVAQTVKNLPAVQETWVQSSGWEDPLEKEMATQSSILA